MLMARCTLTLLRGSRGLLSTNKRVEALTAMTGVAIQKGNVRAVDRVQFNNRFAGLAVSRAQRTAAVVRRPPVPAQRASALRLFVEQPRALSFAWYGSRNPAAPGRQGNRRYSGRHFDRRWRF